MQAAGGAAAIDKVTSRVMKGTIDFGGKSLPIDIYSKDPDASAFRSPTCPKATASRHSTATRAGWERPGVRLREMHGGDLDGASIDADLHLADALEADVQRSDIRAGTEKIGDQEAYVVVGQREGKPPIDPVF